MTKQEMTQLKTLVKELLRLSQARGKESSKVYATAGFDLDHDEDGNEIRGTGDEGWRECYELSGESNGLLEAAKLLEAKLTTFDVGTDKKPPKLPNKPKARRMPKAPANPTDWLNPPQCAEFLGVSLTSIYRMVKRGELPVHPIGKLFRFKRSEVEAKFLK